MVFMNVQGSPDATFDFGWQRSTWSTQAGHGERWMTVNKEGFDLNKLMETVIEGLKHGIPGDAKVEVDPDNFNQRQITTISFERDVVEFDDGRGGIRTVGGTWKVVLS